VTITRRHVIVALVVVLVGAGAVIGVQLLGLMSSQSPSSPSEAPTTKVPAPVGSGYLASFTKWLSG
jgi:hypothetical protein